ncbi:hypothetical protein EC973_001061 [Apophysomyces ossiformis]|uniref:Uncharacterized protein n=1 Tax=Apophysomyces ossiformis TaxID=679940 RepID=A0A8H7BUK5_9FUNG|nr:hypothetical protein EC973_001061 [Apophysomyces ossiformis]
MFVTQYMNAVKSLSIDDKYMLIYGDESSNNKVTVHKVKLQLLMCLVNYAMKNILWWSLTGLLTGYIAMIIVQTYLAREKTGGDQTTKETTELGLYRRTPLWRILWAAIKRGTLVVMVTLIILLLCNLYYITEQQVDPAVLNGVSDDPYMFTFIFMTAPRRGDPDYLTGTLESYLTHWPANPAPHSLYDRTQAIVYTHFTDHIQYDKAMERFAHDPKGQRYLTWVREHGSELNQRLHVSKALRLATEKYQSTYVALMEDDFPVCGSKEWHTIQTVIYNANQQVPDHCGVFVGTGGSGLFLKPHIARLASELLLTYTDMPTDIIIQKCLMGELKECNQCSQTLVTSKTLLMYHIGYNTSTSRDRIYKKNEFQCGWRHPFNGDPSVITI